MKRKVIWLVVTVLTVVALLLASCAPVAVEKEPEQVAPKEEVVVPKEEVVPKEVVVPKEEANMVKWTGTKLDGTVVERMIEKPRYGGTLNLWSEEEDSHSGFTFPSILRLGIGQTWSFSGTVFEKLLEQDPLKGPRGTGDWQGMDRTPDPALATTSGWLAKSWDIDFNNEIIKFTMRDGIYWQNKAAAGMPATPADGKKMTAADVVYTIRMTYNSKYSTWPTARPYIRTPKNPEESVYLDPKDPNTVVIESAPGQLATMWRMLGANWMVWPEALGTGPDFATDWKGLVGTGPFMVADYVAGSQWTYKRNPNYWRHDPFLPENQLPYVDGFKLFVIPDESTQLAALRTGKIDILREITSENRKGFLKTNPELNWFFYYNVADNAMWFRWDKKPFDSVKVRQALMMAINHQEIVNDYYGGEALMFYWPTHPMLSGGMDLYVPIESMPKDVRELYEYHPDKAKQLLAEAGYPNGFTTEIIVTGQKQIDLGQVIQAYWAKVGVTLKLDVKDQVTWDSIRANRSHTAGFWSGVGTAGMYSWTDWLAGARRESGYIGSAPGYPLVDRVRQEALKYYIWDYAEWKRVMQENTADLQREVFQFILPSSYDYVGWQPWVKGFHGEVSPAFVGTYYLHASYIWIDRELKEAMGR